MKKYLYLILLITSFVNAQIVNIPDANFKAKLLSADVNNTIASTYYDFYNFDMIPTTFNKIDINNDGEIQNSETINIQFLDVRNSNISDMAGLEAFVNLKFLICTQNQLSSLNISSNLGLRELYCRNAGVTSLNVSLNSNLRILFCDNNQISNLNVTQNVNLVSLVASGNLLSQIDVTQNTALQSLSVDNNDLSNLNISQNLLLKDLVCSGNLLTNINVTPHSQLTQFFCGSNPLSTVNVTQNANLKTLECSNIGLTTLNVTSNPNLEYLNIGYNNIANIDLSQNTNLKTLHCVSTQMNNLNLSNNVNLESLFCSFNNLTNLDLSNNINLNVLYCQGNPLSTLNIKNGKIENTVNLMANTNLEFICVDYSQISAIQALVGSSVVVNSYCSFTPGGDYNTITGAMIFDANTNGCDALDLPQPNIKININDGTAQGSTFTNNSGNYNFYTELGSFVVTPSVENPSYFTFSPTSATVPFANDNNNIVTQNFCITANGVHPDLEIVIAPIVPARPGFDAVYQIVYKNKGNQTLSQLYGVNFFFNQNLMDFVLATTTPSTVGSGSLSWSYTNLLPFESRSIYVTLNINTPTDTTNPVNIGDILQFTTSILPMAGDESTVDNTFLFNQTVVGSFDPNNIICMEGNVVSPSEIGDYLHYVINFENTGTSEAENIVVKTEVNVTDFDINSLQMLATSHNAYIKVVNNQVEFIFQNIMLETGGHGNVLLKIRSKSNLVNGDIVSKKADIFFDYNFPIDTGMANTTFQALSTGEFVTDNSINIYPNPAVNFVTINSDSTINSIQLYDVQGRLLQTKIENQTEVTFDISNQSNGIYFFKIQSDNGVKVVKLIKE